MIKHFGVSVYVFDFKKRKFLLIKHKKLKKWLVPGGHIELNEDPEEAALREVFEETGIHVKLLGERIPRDTDFIRPLAIQKDVSDHIHVDFVYLAVPLDNQIEVINYDETEGLKWFSLEKINKENFNTFDDLKVWCNKIEKIFNDNKKTYYTKLEFI